jgi:hypothetical protein
MDLATAITSHKQKTLAPGAVLPLAYKPISR